MFARIVQITAKPGQGPNLSQHTRDRTINALKQQPGFIDMLVVKSDTDPNQFVGISLWKSKEEAEKFLASQQWQQLLQEFRPLVQGEPIIRTFNVDASTMHNVGITRAAQEQLWETAHMARFLIEVPHESEALSCARANKVLLESGSHFLTHADMGCRDGVHKAWIVVDAGSKDEARNLLPPVYRRQATIVQLSKFGLEELDDFIKLHEGR